MLESLQDFTEVSGEKKGIITVFLKDSNYTWCHLRPVGHPPEVGQTPVGLLSCLALVRWHRARSKLPYHPKKFLKSVKASQNPSPGQQSGA